MPFVIGKVAKKWHLLKKQNSFKKKRKNNFMQKLVNNFKIPFGPNFRDE
jgi:hypothetical protein